MRERILSWFTYLSREFNFWIDRRNFYDKVRCEWSSFTPLGAPRPHQPSALGLVGAFFLFSACIGSGPFQSGNDIANRLSFPQREVRQSILIPLQVLARAGTLVFALVNAFAIQARASVFFHDPPPRCKTSIFRWSKNKFSTLSCRGSAKKALNNENFVNSVHYSQINLLCYSSYMLKLAIRPKNTLSKDNNWDCSTTQSLNDLQHWLTWIPVAVYPALVAGPGWLAMAHCLHSR